MDITVKIPYHTIIQLKYKNRYNCQNHHYFLLAYVKMIGEPKSLQGDDDFKCRLCCPVPGRGGRSEGAVTGASGSTPPTWGAAGRRRAGGRDWPRPPGAVVGGARSKGCWPAEKEGGVDRINLT